MKVNKLVVSVDAFGEVVAWDPQRVVLASWESGNKKLRLWFGGDLTPPVTLTGQVAQTAWEEVVGLGAEEVRR